MSTATVDDLVRDYLAGSSIDSLAAQLGVNRTTIIHHLDRRGIKRRQTVRKMTDHVDVDARTLAREFRRAGVPIRPRRGWPPSA
jgi:hypothetical protein